MTYSYVAYDVERRLVEGTLSADNEDQAQEVLREAGLDAVSVKRANKKGLLRTLASLAQKSVPGKAVASFSQTLARYLESGLSVSRALELLMDRLPNKALRHIAGQLVARIREGSSLSQAMLEYPQAFSQMYIRLVEVGEGTGNLAHVLYQVARQLRQQDELKTKATRAMAYPCLVLALALAVGTLFVLVIMPRMAILLNALNTDLPWTTRSLLALSDMGAEYGTLAFIVMASLGIGVVWLRRHRRGREAWDLLLLRLPLLGKVYRSVEVARLTRNMSLLLNSGLRLTEALALLEPASGNTAIRKAIGEIRYKLYDGQGLSEGFTQSKVFPREVGDLMMVGEETGRLPETLQSISESYESEADERLKGLVGVITPAMTIVIALAVGFLALSVVAPMYSVAGSFGR